MKNCELCNSLGKMYCESDQAILCWDCDSKVHGANFLVAKHSRILLCHLCQSPTPWNGSGPKLGPTVSICDNCVNNSACREEKNNEETREEEDDDDLDGEDDDNEDDGSDDDDGGDEGDSDGGEEDDDEENQVVPWSSTPFPPVSSSSTSEEYCSSRYCSSQEGASQSLTALSLKRLRGPASRDHRGCSFSPRQNNVNWSNESASLKTFRHLKDQKITVRDSVK